MTPPGPPDPGEEFERLYSAAAAAGDVLPWDRGGPHPLLIEWARDLEGAGRRALVVGSGFGADAELLAECGFEVLAFDVSPTAVASARRRYPASTVDYRTTSLLEPPPGWVHAFDLVVESLTVQSMPPELHPQAIANVARMVAAGGTLLVIATQRDAEDGPVDGPPWPLTRAEIDAFGAGGLEPVRIEDVREPDVPARWRAEFRRH